MLGYRAPVRFINDFLTFLGTTNGSGRWYLWWSGIFSDVTIFFAVLVFYRKHNCHVHRCPRIGSHAAVDANGVQHIVCRRHHPDLGAGHHLLAHHLVHTKSGQPD